MFTLRPLWLCSSLYVCISDCLFAYVSFVLSVFMCLSLCVYMPDCVFMSLSAGLNVCLSMFGCEFVVDGSELNRCISLRPIKLSGWSFLIHLFRVKSQSAARLNRGRPFRQQKILRYINCCFGSEVIRRLAKWQVSVLRMVPQVRFQIPVGTGWKGTDGGDGV